MSDYLNHTPKSELTLSAAPELRPVPSGPVAVLRSERDPLTPALIRELGGVRRRSSDVDPQYIEAHHDAGCDCNITPLTEAELRAWWGDR